MSEPVDTENKFIVAASSRGLVILNPAALMQPISKEDAFNLAAYLVSMTGDDERWQEVLHAIQNA